jgi:5'-deoxynucleotidase YfbR-like HD superfamily hydrolase
MCDKHGDSVLVDTRLAGQVERYHTWPILRRQSVAEHTWQILRIYAAICEGPLNPIIIQHIIFHDVGELQTGDIPYPLKRNNPTLKAEMDNLEYAAVDAQMVYWNTALPVELQPEEKVLVKQMEMLEMAEFGMSEVVLGNQHGWPIANRCLEAIYGQELSPRFRVYVKTRLRQFFAQLKQDGAVFSEPWWSMQAWQRTKQEELTW